MDAAGGAGGNRLDEAEEMDVIKVARSLLEVGAGWGCSSPWYFSRAGMLGARLLDWEARMGVRGETQGHLLLGVLFDSSRPDEAEGMEVIAAARSLLGVGRVCAWGGDLGCSSLWCLSKAVLLVEGCQTWDARNWSKRGEWGPLMANCAF